MKQFILSLCCLGLSLLVALPESLASEQIIIKIAGMKPEGVPETIGMRNFGKYLKELSRGKYDVQVFPNSQLGTEDVYIANTRKGVIQMCATGTQTSSLHPAMAMLETPMLYDNLEHARRALDGDTFKYIVEGFTEKSGLRVLNAFPLGVRHFYTKKPLNTMADLEGLKMRVPNIPLYINFAKECGITGKPMPFAEVLKALDQGVIDGGDSTFADIIALRMYEVTPQITISGHILVIHSMYINEEFYQQLPDQDKQWFLEAAKQAADDVWRIVAEGERTALETITKGGGIVSKPSPKFHKAMQEAGKRSWKLFYDTVPNAKQILDSAASYR